MEAEWEAREPEVSGVRLELDQSATAGSLRVRILSHTVGGLRHYGAVVTPEGAEPGAPFPLSSLLTVRMTGWRSS